MPTIDQFQIMLVLFFQSLGAWLKVPMALFSELGTEEFFILAMPVFFWSVDAGLGLRTGIVLLLTNGLNTILKLAFYSPRPYWIDARVQALSSETSFGMPSNHAQVAASVWGLFASAAKQRALQVTCLVVILVIGLSRINLGMHFPGDVLAGWILGGLTTAGFLYIDKPLTAWVKQRSFSALILLCAATSVAAILAVLLTNTTLGSWQAPAEWISNVQAATPGILIAPRNLDGAFTLGGTWLGFSCGAAWLFRKGGGYSAAGTPTQRLLRYVVGLIGVLILWYGLRVIFPRQDDLISNLLRFFRYALVGLWITALAPLVFRRLGLANLVK